MIFKELVSGNSSKLRVKKPSLSDTYKDEKSYREEIDNLETLIASRNNLVKTLDQRIEGKQEELEDIINKTNLEFEQAELLFKEYLDYEQAIKLSSTEAKNAEQGTLEKRTILEKLSLEENVLRKELINIQDSLSSANANLESVTSSSNDKINESNIAQERLTDALSNLQVVENNLGIRTASLKEIETAVGEKQILLQNFISEAEEKQKEIVPIDAILEDIREKQEMVYQLTSQADELRIILDDGAKLSLSFQSTMEEAGNLTVTMEESEKKRRLRHRLLILEIKDLDVIVAEKTDYISDFDKVIHEQKLDIESHKESIKELMEQEQKLIESMDDIEFRKFVKTSPEVSSIPTLGLSESPFHKTTGVS